ncbi:MAG: AraC family transcriptional regulator [Haliscomenobacter sp.]|nr:AraC family transcriptional regulator [Haliscomenobacter sp.]
MEKEKPYLENDLNLLKLADRLEVNLHTLSFVINEGFRENFAQYINRHRVEEAKKLLEDPGNDHFSMVGIAFTAGFNSKTAFNTAFKKMTGVSPTDFKARRSVL